MDNENANWERGKGCDEPHTTNNVIVHVQVVRTHVVIDD